ncbi:MAG: hypothetical protein QOJ65_2771 [Fimbriimonadaceae bacterium]|jgi:hypothetical protein|nr:hypothetical protein [Fimbriimonadaceae bacterium]
MSETPPPYYANAPKKSNTTTIVLIVLGICAVCCILGVVGVVGIGAWGMKKAGNFIACSAGIAEIQLAMKEYEKDHGGKLPPAKTWQDDIRPYFAKIAEDHKKSPAKFIGTLDPNGMWGCRDEVGTAMTGFAFNSELGGKKVSEIPNPSSTVLLFEVEKPALNLNEPYRERPFESSPKFGNAPRGWLTVTVKGEMKSGKDGSSSNFNIGN